MSQQSTNIAGDTPQGVAVIIIDSGFSPDCVARVKNILGYMDLNSGLAVTGDPMLEGEARELVLSVSRDNLNHGTIILDRLLEMDPNLPFVLVRGFSQQGGLIRTRFDQGKIAADGWTEAYLWAQDLCARRGYLSVANFSFGGFHHALDGSGWESHQLSRVVGEGKPGHLLAAAAGPGDDRAIHASLVIESGATETVHVRQDGTATYNLWVNRFLPQSLEAREEEQGEIVSGSESGCITKSGSSSESGSSSDPIRDFTIQVKLNGESLFGCRGLDLVPNLWNGKQQMTFAVPGTGAVEIVLQLASGKAARFDLFISREEGQARFSDFIDHELVSEPGVLSEVITVGLKQGQYGHCMVKGLHKPEVLVEGSGPISFRTPEVTFALARLLASDPSLDVPRARARLLKL